MRTADFDYVLPKELIAQHPLAERDASRMLVLPRGGGTPAHRLFTDLPGALSEGDLLVANDAKVIPARMRGRKEGSGGRVEVLLVSPVEDDTWLAMVGSSKPVRVGGRLSLSGSISAEVTAVEGEGFARVRFDMSTGELIERLEGGAGELPLPPYIERPTERAGEGSDRERYQTVFASRPGAVAAPTAGLHFTERSLAALAEAGVEVARLTLFVGPGTFLPVRADLIDDHAMHWESYEVPAAVSAAVEATRARGGRVIAVGTTALRALEAAAGGRREVVPGKGRTNLFVRPGYDFRVVDGLITNFHLPRSTLLMLVSALAGTERVLSAYREAVEMRYRFFSYGDAMLIL